MNVINYLRINWDVPGIVAGIAIVAIFAGFVAFMVGWFVVLQYRMYKAKKKKMTA